MSIHLLKARKRDLIRKYSQASNLSGCVQVLTTLLPIAALWYAVALNQGDWHTIGLTAALCLFLLRVFVLMHECGHNSLFRSTALNQVFGFVFGVVAGKPQFVWSQRHAYHHATNGNWEKYRGPLNTMSVDEYAALTPARQRRYRRGRNIWLAPLGGFAYLVVHERLLWLRGSLKLLAHVVRNKLAQPGKSLREHAATYQTVHWDSPKEYWHIFWNNVAVLSLWVLGAWTIGAGLFFAVYFISISVAGAGAIILFTVQHNFEHSQATGGEGWDYDSAALHGTSFLVLPVWLNWFTANIAYHHVHHLSARIPNYRLAACHFENEALFRDVHRITLWELPAALECILWDNHAQRIISVAEYEQQSSRQTMADESLSQHDEKQLRREREAKKQVERKSDMAQLMAEQNENLSLEEQAV